MCVFIYNIIFSGNWGLFKKITAPYAIFKKINLTVKGTGNTIIIDKWSQLNRCKIVIYGNNNVIHIGQNCKLTETCFWIEDDNNEISIADKTYLCGKTQLACIEGTRISIGEGCLFSSDILFRTGDSHSIVDMDGERINTSMNITIGNHVWIGVRAFIGKGVLISDNSIVGACSCVTRKFEQCNVVIAGNPAKIVKENIDWKNERL